MTSTAFGHTEDMVDVLVRGWGGLLQSPLFTPHSTTQDQAVRDGLNVLRTWAFNDGERAGALQPRPGVVR